MVLQFFASLFCDLAFFSKMGHVLGPVLGRTDFFCDFCFRAAESLRILPPDLFSCFDGEIRTHSGTVALKAENPPPHSQPFY